MNKIITNILNAQYFSDLAKTKYDSFERNFYYYHKQKCINSAIAELNTKKHSKILYKIERKPDQNGYISNIYYFEFKIKGVKYQFSFHNPGGEIKQTLGTRSIKWNKIKDYCKTSYNYLRKK